MVLIGVAAFTACASGGGGGTEPQGAAAAGGVAVTVVNDLVPPGTVVVWMTPETGGRRRLGEVQPNGQGTFSYSPAVRSEDHRLVAEQPGGGNRTSNPFILTGVTAVRWSVSSQVVNTTRGQTP